MTDNPWRRVPERNEPDAPEVIPLLSDTEDDDNDDIRGAPITSTSGFTPPSALQNDDQEEAEWLASLQRRKWYKRPSIFWLMPFLLVFITILSMVDGPTEQLGIQLICRDYLAGRLGNPVTAISSGSEIVLSLKEPDDRCKSPEVIAVAARILSQVQGLRGALTLLTLAKWTSLSDSHGRKLLVRVAMLASICSQSLLIFAPTGYNPLGAKVLYVNGALMGLAGGYNLVSPALFAYIADCTSTATRSINMGFTSISAAVGGMIGSFLGGYITKTSGDLTLVNRIALGCLCLLSVYFILVPESKRQISPPSEAQGNIRSSFLPYLQSQKQCRTPFGLIKSFLKSILGPLLLFAPGEVPVSSKVPTRQTLLLLLATRSLATSAGTGLMILFIPLTNLLFHWTAYDDGIFYSFTGASGLVTYTIVFPILQFVYKKYNPSSSHSAKQMAKDDNEDLPQNSDTNVDSVENALDEDLGEQIRAPSSVNTLSTVKMDLTFYIMGLVTFFCSCMTVLVFRSVPALFVCEALFQIANIGSTAFMSMLTTMVPSNQTGRALGAVSVVDTLSSTVATLVYGAVFAAMSKTMPWSHYFISVGLIASAIGIAAVVWTQFRYRGQILLDI